MPINSKLLYIISDDNYFLSHRLGLARAAQKAGYEITVLAYENDTKFTDVIKSHGFEFVGFNQRAHGLGLLDNIKLILQTRRVINHLRPDLIHTVSIRMMFLVTIAFWLSKSKRMVATLTGMGYLETASNPMIRVVKWFVTKAFKIMFSTKRIQLVVQNYDDYAGVKGKFIHEERLNLVRGSGVDIEAFPYLHPPEDKTIQVAFVARMLKDKGVEELVDASRIIQKRGVVNIQINLIGMPHAVNPYSVSNKQLTLWEDAGLVKWHRFRSDIVEVWRESHIAVLSSYREGLPKSLLEAASCGRPIITTDVPGCREMVNGDNGLGKNGLLVPVQNPKALAEAIVELSADAELRLRMGLASRATVVEHFADNVVNKQMLDIYGKK
ncbi:MAG: glycosyltransferase family 4 protein [Proteobacteria bacterium]|nr:glycosyltransferase family 4 protein [Pseudomonadota bacterium]